MSLERVLRLAKKTGDTLIVHNPVDESDLVILDIEAYESLLEERNDFVPDFSGLPDEGEPLGMCDDEDCDCNYYGCECGEDEEDWDDDACEMGCGCERMPKTKERAPWESAGEILGEKYRDPAYFSYGDQSGLSDLSKREGDFTPKEEEPPLFPESEEGEAPSPVGETVPAFEEDIEPTKTPIPMREGGEAALLWDEEEKATGDDPVFYEEPV